MPLVNPQTGGAIPGLTLKAWARVAANGTLISGMNVSSVSRAGAGQYTVNFTVAMAAASYITRIFASFADSGTYTAPDLLTRHSAKTTALFSPRIATNGALADADFYLAVYE